MVDQKDTGSGENNFSSTDKKKSKRPTATLELEATEVLKDGDQKSSSGAAKNKQGQFSGLNWQSFKNASFSDIPPIWSHIAAGITGGLAVFIFLGVTFMLAQETGQTNSADVLSKLTSRLEALETEAHKGEKEALQAYQNDLKALNSKISAVEILAKNAGQGSDITVESLNNQLDKASTAYDKKIAELKQQLETVIKKQVSQASEDVKKSFPPEAVASGKLNIKVVKKLVAENLAEMNLTIEAVRKQKADVAIKVQQYEALVQDLNKKIASLTNEITSLRAQSLNQIQLNTSLSPVSKRIASLEAKLSNMAIGTNREKYEARNTALSLAFTGLKRAADRGDSFDDEIEAFKDYPQFSGALSSLHPYQEKGVPTMQSLEKRFKPLIREILKADSEPETPSLWAKFTSNAASFVRFRRTGNIPGGTAEAIVARMEYNLKKGKYEKTLEDGKLLKGPAKAAADIWMNQLEARLKLDNVLQKVEMSLLSRLGGTHSENKKEVH